MDCLEFRRRLGAEPHARDRDLLAHRDSCAACMAAWERAQHFEHTLLDALTVPVPAGLAERALLAQATGERRQHRRRWQWGWAIAASLLVAVAGGGIAWRHMDAQSLPALAVAHMHGEMASLDLTRPIPAQAVVAGFAGRKTALRGPLPTGTTYVHDCEVGPYTAVHLVSRDDDASVAVLYLPHKQVGARRDFRRDGWRGREVPLERGTLVLLTDRSDKPPFDAIEQAWRLAIDGLGGPRVSVL